MNNHIFKFTLAFFFNCCIIYIFNKGVYNKPPLGKILDPFNGIWQNVEINNNKNKKRTKKINGITNPIKIVIDTNSIPSIISKNDNDLFFAMGFISAKNRLWKMDFLTRSAEGRLSEIFGYDQKLLRYDISQRHKAISRAANSLLQKVLKDEETKECLNAYANGINSYINSLTYKDLPIEFKLLNYFPEKWSPYKTLLCILAMVDRLSNKDSALEYTNAYNFFGDKKFNILYPEHPQKVFPIISLKDWDQFPKLKTDEKHIFVPEGFYKKSFISKEKLGISNNWVISSQRTGTNKTYLANDPHLDINLPSVFYLMRVKSPSYNVCGAMIPGMPAIIVGFNEFSAFGMTNSMISTKDLFIIEFKDETMKEYKYEGKYFKSEACLEEIKIKGKKSIYEKVIFTHLGPVYALKELEKISDEKNIFQNLKINKENKTFGVSLKWLGHNLGNIVLAFLKLNKSQNFSELTDAFESLEIPLNYAYASKENDFGMHICGKYPLKFKNQGKFLMFGDEGKNDWNNYIPSHQNPRISNPNCGYVYSANQYPISPKFPYYLHSHFYKYFRAEKISQYFESKKKFTLKDMVQMQLDTYDISAELLLPELLSNIEEETLNHEEKQILYTLKDWGYYNNPEEVAPSIFREWRYVLFDLIWDIIKPENLSLLKPNPYIMVELIKGKVLDKIFFNNSQFSMKDLIQNSFTTVSKNLNEWERKHKKKYKWADYQNISLNHIIPNFKSFSVKNIRIGGSRDTINTNERKYGVCLRFIAEISPNKTIGYFIYPGGQIGNPLSKNYDNLVDKWVKGKYLKLTLLNKDLKTDSTESEILYLQPKKTYKS